MHRYAVPALGAYTALFTFIIFIYLVVLLSHVRDSTQVQSGAMAAAAMQTTTFVMLAWSASLNMSAKMHEMFGSYNSVIYVFGMASSIAAAAVSITTAVWLSERQAESEVIYLERRKYVQGLAAFTAFAWVGQLAFLTVQYASNRAINNGTRAAFSRSRPVWPPIKSVRYSRTAPRRSESSDDSSIAFQKSPTALKSHFDTSRSLSEVASDTLTGVWNPLSARAKQLLQREKKSRPLSLYSHLYNQGINQQSPTSPSYTRRPERPARPPRSPAYAAMPKANTLQTIPITLNTAGTQHAPEPTPSPSYPRRTKSFSPSPAARTSFIPENAGDVHIHPVFREATQIAPVEVPGESCHGHAERAMANRRSMFSHGRSRSSIDTTAARQAAHHPPKPDMMPAPLELPASPVKRLPPAVTRLSYGEVGPPPPIPNRSRRKQKEQKKQDPRPKSFRPPPPPKDY